ncbi:DUF3152 domain-containing protein [Corynebacterium pygosceleis]|uniref:DUF3152 domain-containing protein n=1 Tax=Corynebacterium pygosceleis TaxID=2800406 RepID=A0A9Q4C9I3_9CORY|nr:DUF3152 domain-containing protein [Corynebacterium pygosceleis]MCK7637731.1 DUF3152 domain-containing protein [Corynebacterium pygosceleis]MCK7674922.1 DUF3152 domain-containing protein [Corynebacterium pygosceleis]MCL0119489.1 DUF3152 domain-containing protein [Corynebacterium pygosceleis]MCX7444729.1 DUF3152 domain-containing protein [Corynebacterium pygosceleis]MCX7467940.1 DUF3152 domain-containing protein [Corynebacterium pygosceleis]
MLVRFAREYGWRAYAIPVLIVITVWVLVSIFTTDGPEVVAPQATSRSGPASGAGTSPAVPVAPDTADPRDPGLGSGPNPADAPPPVLPNGELPPGSPYTEKGTGEFRAVGHAGPPLGRGERTFTYVVEIENGVDAAVYGGDDAVAAMVDATLSDPRGWTADPRFAFQHIDANDPRTPDLRIQLTSVGTTHELCGHSLEMETSCFYSDGNRVLLNESRWIRGALPFDGDLGSYRQYLINHEVGHGIGFASHEPCGGDGALAPVMMQQTLSLSNSVLTGISPNEIYPDDGAVCRYNPWPYPHA